MYAASLAVVIRGKVLLQKRAGDKTWCFPGGRSEAEDGGKGLNTALREFSEEMGTGMVSGRLRKVVSGKTPSGGSHFLYILTARDFKWQITPDMKEVCDYGWYDPTEAIDELDLHPGVWTGLTEVRSLIWADALERYNRLEKRLAKQRRAGTLSMAGEEAILEAMDDAWALMSPAERSVR